MTKKSKRQHNRRQPDPKDVDAYARILQMLGLIAVVAVLAIDNLVKDTTVPVWVVFGILGVAVGLSPEQILSVIKDLLKSFTGRR